MADIKTKSPKEQTYDQNLKEAQKLLRTVFPDSKSPNLTGALKEYRSAAKLTDDPKASPQAVMAQTVESLRANAASSTVIKPQASAADRIPTNTPADVAAANPVKVAANPGGRTTMQNDPRLINTAAAETPAASAENPATTAAAAPATASTIVAGDRPLEAKNTSQDMLKMLFIAIAQILGINLTALQQTQAGQPVKPAMAVAAATPATAAPMTFTATPTPTPSVAADLPATTPVTLTTGAGKLETDEQRRDRLGMSPKQYEGLLAEQKGWSADQKRPSPFVSADIEDKKMQEHLGLNDAKWTALKKEQQTWQTNYENDIPVAKTGPMAAAVMAINSKPAADPMIKDPYAETAADLPPAGMIKVSAEAPAVTRGLTQRHEQHMQILAQGDAGISGRNSPADKAQILEALRRQAETDPNFASKLDALNTMKVGIQIGNGSTKIDKNAYEVKINPRDLASGAPILDIAIGKVIEGKHFNIENTKADADRGGYILQPSQIREINRDQKDMDRLQSVLPETRVGRPVPAAPQVVPQAAPVSPRMPAPSQPAPMVYVSPSVTPSFNTASGLDDIMQRRDMRMAAIITTAQQISPSGRPVGIAAAERAVTAGRIQDLKNMRVDNRQISTIIGEEKRVTQQEVSDLLKFERNGYVVSPTMVRSNSSINQTIQRNSTDLRVGGQAFGTLLGMKSGDARSLGNGLGAINGLISRNNPEILSPGQETPNDRRNATDMRVGVQAAGNLANMGSGPAAALGKLAGAVTGLGSRNNFQGSYDQSQYRVIEYPQQSQRNGYVPQPRMDQNFSYDAGPLKDAHAGSARYGVSEKERTEIIRDYEAQRTAPTAEPPATGRQYRQPSSIDFTGG